MRQLLQQADPSVLLYGSLRLGNGQRYPVTVTHISSDRCQVQLHDMLPLGAVVQLDVPGRDPVNASVHWTVIGKTGLLFI